MYPAGFYYSSSSGNKAHKSRIHNYVSTLAKNGWAMAGPVGPVPVPMLYGNQVESYLVMWLAILFKNGDEEDNDSRAVFINSATFGFGLVSSCSEHLASSWKLWCKNGGKKKNEKAGSCRESNLGHLAHTASALPLSLDNQTTTNPYNLLCVLHRWYWMPQLHTWQQLSMCCQNSVRGRLEIFVPSGKNPCWVVFSL